MNRSELCTPVRSERKSFLTPNFLSKTISCTPQSPLSVKKRPTTPNLKLLTPLKPSTPSFLLSSTRLQHLFVTRTRAQSWPDLTPECARGLEWDTVLDYRTPLSRDKWEYLSPLRGSPAKRLFSWAFEGQLEFVSFPGLEDEVFPLKDLDQNVTHELTVNEYEFLPSVI